MPVFLEFFALVIDRNFPRIQPLQVAGAKSDCALDFDVRFSGKLLACDVFASLNTQQEMRHGH